MVAKRNPHYDQSEVEVLALHLSQTPSATISSVPVKNLSPQMALVTGGLSAAEKTPGLRSRGRSLKSGCSLKSGSSKDI